MEHLSFDLEIKADDESRTVEGWASVFDYVDSGKDIVLPGAFAKSLARRKASDKVPLLWQHDAREPIGVWDELKEIDKGLYGKGRILATSRGDDAYELLKGGAIKGLSIGYATKQYEIDQKKNVRILKELDLFEVSLVTFPMNDKSQVTRVKSLVGDLMTEREFEEFLRDVGCLSLKEAKTVVSRGYRSLLNCRDGEDGELATIAEMLRQFNLN